MEQIIINLPELLFKGKIKKNEKQQNQYMYLEKNIFVILRRKMGSRSLGTWFLLDLFLINLYYFYDRFLHVGVTYHSSNYVETRLIH